MLNFNGARIFNQDGRVKKFKSLLSSKLFVASEVSQIEYTQFKKATIGKISKASSGADVIIFLSVIYGFL
jgi:hypothetical protein